ncbi:protein phosphatase regulator [Maudiozyma humilis]|uniref:Protein phosphatase regulator n=1 Tax=Maudiozyma humilis TaxID=51915 RepID=A0AAV5RSN3_MAUHU|nr:protein phosphatase regulator [Kazachstania humilis]
MLIASMSDSGASVSESGLSPLPRLRSKSTKELASILKKQPAMYGRNRSLSANALHTKKNVRFSVHLTEIKKFDKFAEPITISNEASPELSPLLVPLDYSDARGGVGGDDDSADGCWFRDLRLLPALINIEKGFDEYRLGAARSKSNNNKSQNNRRNKLFSLEDNDSDNELDYYLSDAGTLVGPRSTIANYTLAPVGPLSPTQPLGSPGSPTATGVSPLNGDDKWDVRSTNIINSNIVLSDDCIRHFMHGQNIRVQSLRMDAGGSKLVGYLVVSNLAFEKYIEVKFTFNGWENIHYVNAAYLKTVSQHYDQFKFVIDVRSFKFFLNLKNLLREDTLSIELCCRYDVRHETYYDNNNYNNYKVVLARPPTPAVATPRAAPAAAATAAGPTPAAPALGVTASASKAERSSTTTRHHTRTFSADTDFFNTSPLKDMYRNSMINIGGGKTRKAKRPHSTIGLNLVAQQSAAAASTHTAPEPLPERVMRFNSDLSSISSESMSSVASSASTDSTASSSLYSFRSDNTNTNLNGPRAASNNSSNSTDTVTVAPLAKQPTPIQQQHATSLNFTPRSDPLAAPPDIKTDISMVGIEAQDLTLDCINNYLSPSLSDIKDQLYLSPSRNSAVGKNTNDNITITSTPESVATDTTIGRNVARVPQETKTPVNKSPAPGPGKASEREPNGPTKPQLSPLSSLDADYQTLLDSCCFYTPPTFTHSDLSSNHLTFMSSMTD